MAQNLTHRLNAHHKMVGIFFWLRNMEDIFKIEKNLAKNLLGETLDDSHQVVMKQMGSNLGV
ncbi:MAG: hypothetical protein KGJ73_09315 [Rhodospirillales bacterium]|nr:hypothetical protein [Rhodospirillales bacterium]